MCKPLIFGSGVSSFKDEKGLMAVCGKALDESIFCFDTAPSYGTEKVLSRCILTLAREKGLSREQLVIQTKIDPIQMFHGNVEEYFKTKLKDMGLEYVDALLIHWPVYKYFFKTWEEINQLKKEGFAKKIGICNLRIEHLRKLKEVNIIPEILQIERHPLNTFEEERQFCIQNGIELQDYSPLCKMHPLLKDNPLLKNLVDKYGKSVGAIILRWHVDTSATPIFTSKKIGRIEEYSEIESFQLSSEDILAINSLNINHKLYLESLVCPGF